MESDQKRRHREYINSPEWKARAAYYKALAGNRCRVCNSDDETLDAHHRTYERLGNEWDSDITVLCRSCHELYESKRRGSIVETPFDSESVKAGFLGHMRDKQPFLYNTMLAQAIGFVVTDVFMAVIFGSQHEVLAQEAQKRAGHLSDCLLESCGRRMPVFALTGSMNAAKESRQCA